MSEETAAAAATTTDTGGAESSIPDADAAPPEVTGEAPEGGAEDAPPPGETEGAAPVEGEPPPEGGEPAPEPVTYKVDGQEVQLDPSEAAALEKVFGSREKAQKALAAERRFDEAHKLRTEAQQYEQVVRDLQQAMRQDPRLAALLRGDDQAFLRAVEEQLEYQGLAPEERKRVDQEREMRRKAEEYERLQRERERQQATQQAQQDAQALGQLAEQSLQGVGLDAADGYLVERWAGEMQAQYDAGRKPDPKAAAQRVKAWAEQAHQGAYQSLAQLEGDALLQRLDELGITAKVRAADAKRLKAREIERTRGPAGQFGRRAEAPAGEKPMTTAQYLKRLRMGKF